MSTFKVVVTYTEGFQLWVDDCDDAIDARNKALDLVEMYGGVEVEGTMLNTVHRDFDVVDTEEVE